MRGEKNKLIICAFYRLYSIPNSFQVSAGQTFHLLPRNEIEDSDSANYRTTTMSDLDYFAEYPVVASPAVRLDYYVSRVGSRNDCKTAGSKRSPGESREIVRERGERKTRSRWQHGNARLHPPPPSSPPRPNLALPKKSSVRKCRRNAGCRMPVTRGPTLELARALRFALARVSLIPQENVCRERRLEREFPLIRRVSRRQHVAGVRIKTPPAKTKR